MDYFKYILEFVKNFILNLDKDIILSIIVLLICLFLISGILLISNRKQRKIIKSNVDYTSKTELIVKLNEEINNIAENKKLLESVCVELSDKSDQLLNENNSTIKSIKEKELLVAQLNTKITELEIEIEDLKNQMSDEKITELDLATKLDKEKQDFKVLNDNNYMLISKLQPLENQKILLETENSNLTSKKRNLEREISELGIEFNKLKNLSDENLHVKYIGYKPTNKFKNDCYPAVMMPQPNSVLKFPRRGRTGTRGFTEQGFEKYLRHYFKQQNKIQFYTDRILVISDNSYPYETDFVLQDEIDKLNLFIDIEIDEPYDGDTRVPTHFKGQDNYKNQFFNNRGWIVIRFTEKQVHKQPKACCKVIAEVIGSINRKFLIPDELKQTRSLQIENFWSKEKAEQWANENYRENYLLINSFQSNKAIKPIPTISEQTQDEIETEKKVNLPKIPFKRIADFNEANAHVSDKKIEFVMEPLDYLFGKHKRTTWARTLVKNKLGVNEYSKATENLYPKTHLNIHNYIQRNVEISPLKDKIFEQFHTFYRRNFESISPYRTNWKIFDNESCILGTVDLLSDNHDGTFTIYNWKINGKIKQNNKLQKEDLSFQNIEEYNYVCYCLELNIYKKILEKCYHKPISKMYFVQFHSTIDSYNLFSVEIMNEETDELFQFAKENNLKLNVKPSK